MSNSGSKVRRLPAVVALAAVLATACAGTESRPEVAPGGSAVRPGAVQPGGTLVVGGTGEPANGFNPKNPKSSTGAVVKLMANVWPGVWKTTPDFRHELDSELMVSAEMTSTDPQTVVYKIRPEAVWSDGVAVSADDFIYNWEASRPGATDIDGSALQAIAIPTDPIASVTGSDGGRTVTVVYKTRFGPWKERPFSYLVPAHVARRVGWNTGFDRFDPSVIVSAGPFRIASYKPGQDLTLVRNERYWGRPANLDSIVFRSIFGTEQAAAFKNGEIDVIDAFEPNEDLLGQMRGLPGTTEGLKPGRNQLYVGFNFRNELLALPEVRRALALALDRSAIAERALGRDVPVAVVNSFLLMNSQPEYRDNSGGRYDRPDVSGAKRLLEGAGFTMGGDGVYAREGKRLSFRTRAPTGAAHVAAQELVRAQVLTAGIELRIDNAPFPVIDPQLLRGDFDIEVINYGKNLQGTVNQFRPGNRWAYPNPRPDQLIQQTTTELDDAKRVQLLYEADRMLWEDLPIVPLFQVPVYLAVRDAFTNVVQNVASPAGIFWNARDWGRKA